MQRQLMNHEATLILPHQLFANNSLLISERPVYLVEDERFFTEFSFHKHKLILHRASMQEYYQSLKKDFKVYYIPFKESSDFFKLCFQKNIKKIHYFDPVDVVLEKRFEKQSRAHGVELCSYETPHFMTEQGWLNDYYGDNKRSFFMASFYKEQRLRLNILVTKEGKPQGGSWSYDVQNRSRIPSDLSIPSFKKNPTSPAVEKAKGYVDRHFANNPGSSQTFWYAVTHESAKAWYDDFLKKRFALFGPYEDAIRADNSVLFHSVLAVYLNCGLLTPDYCIQRSLTYAQNHEVPLNSLEGFVRQIIGWREFMRAVYVFKENEERTTNFWRHKRSIPRSFWNATTGIEPIDCTIKKVIDHSYVHHIERLMVLGNFMLLCEFDPTAVYSWFMELFIDAYDWVMVPNVYGMSQYADGGLFATKPYISSSNYILTMSDFKKGDWCATWDSLYWHFLYKHKDYFASLGRLAVMNYQLKRMKPEVLKGHLKRAEQYLKSL